MQLWNTKTKQLETFKPISPEEVGLYSCGPTVYNPPTIGNLRSYIFSDILRRSLELCGFKVKQVMNITDVGHLVGDGDEGEDKVEREARAKGRTAWDIAKAYEAMFKENLDELNIERPEIMPRATDHIDEQIDLIQELEEKSYTYRTSDGIYFDTSKFAGYGKFSGQKLEDKQEGARVESNPEKRNPADFALWKLSEPQRASPALDAGSKTEKRQMEWMSPWGKGFPGWHVECSAMSVKYLGQPFDIHTGGIDHIPVHHENEIAQSVAAHGRPLAHYWLHNEFLLVNGRRMGKSEGNAYTLQDLKDKGFDPLAYRYYCLGTHYRAKMNFTWEGLEAASHALSNLKAMIRDLTTADLEQKLDEVPWRESFDAAITDDLNTPKALAALWDMLKSDLSPEEKSALVMYMDKVFGLKLAEEIGNRIDIPEEIRKLAEERAAARQAKDWKTSDKLRDELAAKGWQVEDGEDGTFHLEHRSRNP